MDGAGHLFLARARLAGDEHRGAAGRGTVHHDQHIADGAAAAHDLVHAVALFHGFLQQAVLPVGAGQLRGVVDGEQQLVVGVLPAQGAERIDGIALALARHLEVEHLDLDAALKRGLSAHEARHGETVLVRGAPLLHHLVRRDTRRNEQKLIQRALLRRLDGGVLVPQMRRVEAAAVNSDLQ